MVMIVNNTGSACLKAAKGVLKILTGKKKMCHFVWWQAVPYFGCHFAVHTDIKSLHCITETNIMVYINYISV